MSWPLSKPGAAAHRLVNPQVVRTADMVEMKCIVFVRGKVPGPDILALAEERDIVGDDLPQAHV